MRLPVAGPPMRNTRCRMFTDCAALVLSLRKRFKLGTLGWVGEHVNFCAVQRNGIVATPYASMGQQASSVWHLRLCPHFRPPRLLCLPPLAQRTVDAVNTRHDGVYGSSGAQRGSRDVFMELACTKAREHYIMKQERQPIPEMAFMNNNESSRGINTAPERGGGLPRRP